MGSPFPPPVDRVLEWLLAASSDGIGTGAGWVLVIAVALLVAGRCAALSFACQRLRAEPSGPTAEERLRLTMEDPSNWNDATVAGAEL